MTYTEGWPKMFAGLDPIEVVPLSDARKLEAERDNARARELELARKLDDAERLREERDEADTCWKDSQLELERLRKALERALDESHTYETLRGRVIAALDREGEPKTFTREDLRPDTYVPDREGEGEGEGAAPFDQIDQGPTGNREDREGEGKRVRVNLGGARWTTQHEGESPSQAMKRLEAGGPDVHEGSPLDQEGER
jgi:hypothetical protein